MIECLDLDSQMDSRAAELFRQWARQDFAVEYVMTDQKPVSYGDERDLFCMAQNIYYETFDFHDGRKIAAVVLNRKIHPSYPNEISKVIWQRRQFSWTLDGRSDKIRINNRLDEAKWIMSIKAARLPYEQFDKLVTHYHARYVSPAWSRQLIVADDTGVHVYYTLPPN